MINKFCNKSTLIIYQINMNRQSDTHDIALFLMNEKKCDIIIIQKFWIITDLSTHLFKNYFFYIHFVLLFSIWSKHSQIILYIQCDRTLALIQIIIDIFRDLICVSIKISRYKWINIYNVYNIPAGAIDSDQDFHNLLQFSVNSIITSWLLIDDFNIRYAIWDSIMNHRSLDDEDLYNWILSQDL